MFVRSGAMLLVVLLCGSLATRAVASEPMPGFPLDGTRARCVNLDGDAALELIVSNGWQFFVYSSGGELELGPSQGISSNKSIAIADADGDGALDFYVSTGTWMYLLTSDLELFPGWPIHVGSTGKDIVAADLDGDGAYEVVYSDSISKLFAYDAEAELVPGWPIPLLPFFEELPPFAATSNVLAAADMDHDGDDEIVVGCYLYHGIDFTAYPSPVLVFQGDAQLYSGWSTEHHYTGFFELVAVDFDDDPRTELVLRNRSGDPRLRQDDGTHMPGVGPPPQQFGRELAIGDFEGDGELEVLFGIGGGVRLYSLLGDPFDPPIASFDIFTGGLEDTWGFRIADFTGDGVCEFTYWFRDNEAAYVYLLDYNLEPLPGWPKVHPSSYPGARLRDFAVVDLDADGDLEVVYAFLDKIWAWDVPRTGPLPCRIEWGERKGDLRNSSWYEASRRHRYALGDANADGNVDIADVVGALESVFGDRELPCRGAIDVNEDVTLELSDVVLLLTALYFDIPDEPLLDGECRYHYTIDCDVGCP